MLNLNLKDASEAVYYNKLSKEVMDYLHAYSDGVNYFLEHEKETYRYAFLALPLEFTLVGHEPEPWKAADTMATLKLMCYIGNTILRYTTTLHPKYNNPQLTHVNRIGTASGRCREIYYSDDQGWCGHSKAQIPFLASSLQP